MISHLRETAHGFQKWSGSVPGASGPRAKRLPKAIAAALALLLPLTVCLRDSHAANFYWTGGNDFWQSTTAWNFAPLVPGSGDNALFTNAATYSVTLNADVLNIQSNFFSNASNTTATVTLNLNGYELSPVYAGTSPGAFNVGDGATSTTIVYLASSTVPGKGLVVPGRVIVGRSGYGTLIVTNGNVSSATTLLANGNTGRGLLVLSGPSVIWTNSTDFAVGNNSNSFGSALVISNSAVLSVGGLFRVGSGSSQGGSTYNTLLLDTGARLYTHSGPVTVGNNGSATSTAPSYNNSATVQGGAVWDNGNSSFVVGYAPGAGAGAATGNVLTVGIGGSVINVSHGTFTTGNTLNMAGGTFNGTVDCAGILQGFGTVYNNVNITGSLAPSNSFGTLAFSNQLNVGNTAITSIQLGTNFNPTVVRGVLTLGGTLNFTDGGGFTNGTYTLFSYNSTLTYNGTIGTTPNTNWNYAISLTTPHAVNLIVTGPTTPPVANFTGSPTAGGVPLAVTFTDTSTGTITNRAWSFGDGAISNTMLTSLTHTYSTTGTFDVSLTVLGPLGSSNLTQIGYITATNVPLPTITTGVSVTDAPLQVGNTIVLVAGDTNVFNIGATDTTSGSLTYQWSFGDGATTDFLTTNTVEHVYTNDCGPYVASVTISNGIGAITSNFNVIVACQLNLSKVQPKLNFAKTNSDSCTLMGSFPLPSSTIFTGQQATVDIGGASLTFAFPAKGTAVNGLSKFSIPKLNKKTGLWALKVTFKNGFWQTPWADYSMINSNIPKPGVAVTNLPVVLLLDSEAFMATTNLTYTATQGKSGAAK